MLVRPILGRGTFYVVYIATNVAYVLRGRVPGYLPFSRQNEPPYLDDIFKNLTGMRALVRRTVLPLLVRGAVEIRRISTVWPPSSAWKYSSLLASAPVKSTKNTIEVLIVQ